jgi:hypothetical protein
MMKKIAILVIALTLIPLSPTNAAYAGQYCKESQVGNVEQKLKSKFPKPKYDSLQCQLKGKRYKWVKISK